MNKLFGSMNTLLLIIYGFIAYLIYDILIRKKNLDDDFEDHINVGSNLSYPDYKYKEFADKAYYAMDNPMTDEDALYEVFRSMKTSSDVRKLKEVFGLKGYTGGVAGNLGVLLNPDVTLAGWISLEGETENVNRILASKGIKERV
jgi:hypothetical protein